MSPLTEFIGLLVKAAEDNCNLENKISLDELTRESGLYVEIGQGVSETVYYDKSTVMVIPVNVLCCNLDQQKCLDQLCEICNYLQKLETYPKGETFTWLDTKVAKWPFRTGRDADDVYHYSCIINCKLYF